MNDTIRVIQYGLGPVRCAKSRLIDEPDGDRITVTGRPDRTVRLEGMNGDPATVS